MSPVRRLAVPAALLTPALGLVLVLVLVLAGCSGDASSTPASAPTTVASDDGTPLADVDTSALVVGRAPFCDLVDPATITSALGSEPTEVSARRSGQRAHVTDDVTDVVHEFGCTWAAGGSRAEAWVFVPPVTRPRATALARLARQRAGCTELADAPAYGDPSVALSCRLDSDNGTGIAVSFRGLFGDAWLACSLTTPGGEQEELTDRAGRWCAAVAEGAAQH
jgi:hypothetical protein